MRPVLIIDFGSRTLSAGVFNARDMEKIFSVTNAVKDDPLSEIGSVIEEVRNEGYTEFSRVLVSLPLTSVSIRIETLPFIDKKKIEEILPFKVGKIFTKPLDELILAAYPLEGGRTLVAALEKDLLRDYIEKFNELQIDPSWIGTSLFSKDRLLKSFYDGDEPAAFLDSESMVVVKDQKPCFFKEIKDDADLRLALASLEEEGIKIGPFYCTQGNGRHANPPDNISVIPISQYSDEETGLMALALHLKDGFGDAVSFRKGEFADTREFERTKKDFRTIALLVILLNIVWAGHIYLSYQAISNNNAQVKEIVASSYRDIFPKEVKAIDPLYQLEAKLRVLKEERGITDWDVRVLDVMRRISEAAASDGKLKIYQLRLAGDRLTAKGETGSFEEANRFKDVIARLPYFKDLVLTDVKSRAGGGVSFSVALAMKNVER